MVFLNGRCVPAQQAVVSVCDRGFLYGDGLFETVRVMNGVPLRWDPHWRRMADGAEVLKIKLPFTSEFLRVQAAELSRQNRLPESLLRITLSRGAGPRGYSPEGATTPTLVMSLHPAPALDASGPHWKLHTASLQAPAGDALSTCKSANKLLHVLARAEADAAGTDDALLLNPRGEIAEAGGANIFWIEGGSLNTPPLSSGALPGVTRADVLAWCRSQGVEAHETAADLARLRRADGCFLTSSSWGVVEVVAVDGCAFPLSTLASRVRAALQESWRAEANCVG